MHPERSKNNVGQSSKSWVETDNMGYVECNKGIVAIDGDGGDKLYTLHAELTPSALCFRRV